jgi:hypothetical protein
VGVGGRGARTKEGRGHQQVVKKESAVRGIETRTLLAIKRVKRRRLDIGVCFEEFLFCALSSSLRLFSKDSPSFQNPIKAELAAPLFLSSPLPLGGVVEAAVALAGTSFAVAAVVVAAAETPVVAVVAAAAVPPPQLQPAAAMPEGGGATTTTRTKVGLNREK